MTSTFKRAICAGLSALALSAGAIDAARATEGYVVEGNGAREQALGGAGMANPADAFTTANNPAGLVDVGRQFNGDISAFMPSRGYSATNTALTAPGNYTSGRDVFPIPAVAYSMPMSADAAIGLSVTGNGGMDTSYAANTRGAMGCMGGMGVFCAGKAGVDLNQGLISLGYAQRFGNLSIGLAPTVAAQVISAYGLGAFGAFGLSSNPSALTNNYPAWSIGVGVRAGALYRFDDQLSVALAGSTPMWMTSFAGYSGLFAQKGQFNVPATIGLGLSYKVAPTLALMLDYKHIFYSSIKSIGDAMSSIGPGSLGTDNGPGFGWRDVNVVSLGAEWTYSPALILRAGYTYNTQPVTPANVMFNILAPGVVQHHISGGFTYNVTPNSGLDFAVVYAPRQTVSGYEYIPYVGYNTLSNISIHLEELEVTAGYTYHFDVPAPVIAAKY